MSEKKNIQKLTIKGEFTDLNTYINAERRNKFIAAKIKKDDTYRAMCYARRHLKSIQVPDVQINITWYSKNRRKDKDNISFAKKFIIDGIVAAGVLKDDGYKNIKGFTDTFMVDKENPRVELELVY